MDKETWISHPSPDTSTGSLYIIFQWQHVIICALWNHCWLTLRQCFIWFWWSVYQGKLWLTFIHICWGLIIHHWSNSKVEKVQIKLYIFIRELCIIYNSLDHFPVTYFLSFSLLSHMSKCYYIRWCKCPLLLVFELFPLCSHHAYSIDERHPLRGYEHKVTLQQEISWYKSNSENLHKSYKLIRCHLLRLSNH